MKKLITAVMLSFAGIAFAQGPVIEATYFPVKNTMIKQVWSQTGPFVIPTPGSDQIWDYRTNTGQFTNILDTTDYKFLDPAASPYAGFYPNATHVTYLRNPMGGLADSMYVYWEINRQGMWYLGGYNVKQQIDSSQIATKPEFYTPNVAHYLESFTDTSYTIGYAKNYNSLGYRAKIKRRKIKTTTYVGYGKLLLPNASYNNVALFKETSQAIDSVYVDLLNNGNYTYLTNNGGSGSTYFQFMRNNTFGSNLLLYMCGNFAGTSIDFAWYTLPTDIGSISGNVFADNAESAPVTSGEMYLYRENSNFTKNDILAKTPISPSGSFQFDSIPYGEYRIAARPNYSVYPNSKITYFGDTTNWIDAVSIITTNSLSSGHKIHLQYHPSPIGTSSITGTIGEDWNYNRGSGISASIPVPGVGVVIKKHPGNSAARVIPTDPSGQFELTDLDDGDYSIFVDIPGLHMAGTYSFSVLNGSVIGNLNFTVGNDSIHPFGASVISVKELESVFASMPFKAYPNPSQAEITVEFELKKPHAVKVELFDIKGKRVQTITNKKFEKGIHKLAFDLNDKQPQGVYFLKETLDNGNSRTIKIIYSK
ncbi:MAG: T9SS type A sorting domain-containing protein [Bacteroidia bacterium]